MDFDSEDVDLLAPLFVTACDVDIPFRDVEVFGDKLDHRGIGFSIFGRSVNASDPASVVLLDQALLRAVGFDVHDQALGREALVGCRIHSGLILGLLDAAAGWLRIRRGLPRIRSHARTCPSS